MTSLDHLAHVRYQRQQAVNDPPEYDEPVKRAIAPERFQTCAADRGYLSMTDYEVTEETFAREERRKARNVEGDDPRMPPGGLVCSARLGEVSKLL
jgi:hypothetical protein